MFLIKNPNIYIEQLEIRKVTSNEKSVCVLLGLDVC